MSEQLSLAPPLLEHWLRLDPKSVGAYSLRGLGWFEEDPTAEGQARAEADFNRALRANPRAPFPDSPFEYSFRNTCRSRRVSDCNAVNNWPNWTGAAVC